MTPPPRLPDELEAWLDKKYGDAWLAYLPAVMAYVLYEDEAISDYHDPSTIALLDQIQALRSLRTTTAARFDYTAFERIVHALCGDGIDPFSITGCTPGQLVFAFRHCKALRRTKFEEHILDYIAACMQHAGVVAFPKELRFAQRPVPDDVAAIRKSVYAAETEKTADTVDRDDPVSVQRWKMDKAGAVSEAIAGELSAI